MPLLFSYSSRARHLFGRKSADKGLNFSNEILVDNLIPINSVRDRELSFD